MKQIISATSAVLMMSVLCLSACASEPTQTEFPTPEKYVITTSTECTAEEYISAVALEKKNFR